MRFVIHPDALWDYIDQDIDTLNSRAARIAKKAVNNVLLDNYKRVLGEMFGPWVLKEEAGNRLALLDIQSSRVRPVCTDLQLKECICLSHCWGKILAMGTSLLQATETTTCLKEYDLLGMHLNDNTPEIAEYQFSPMIEYRLKDGDEMNFDPLRRYFNYAQNIAVFDKFFALNSNPLNYLIKLLSPCKDNFKLTIFVKDCNVHAMQKIKDKISQQYPNCTVSVLNFFKSSPTLHDRHIYIDNFFQMDFSAGFDSFNSLSRSSFKITAENKISIYSTCESVNKTIIYGREINGNVCNRSYRSA